MAKKKHVPEEAIGYLKSVKDSVESVQFQMKHFATPEKVYILHGDITKMKADITRVNSLLNRIITDLKEDGEFVYKPSK